MGPPKQGNETMTKNNIGDNGKVGRYFGGLSRLSFRHFEPGMPYEQVVVVDEVTDCGGNIMMFMHRGR